MAWRDPWENVDRANALRAQTDMQGVNMLSALQGAQHNALQMQQAQAAAADEAAARQAFAQSGGVPEKFREALMARGDYKRVQANDAADLAKREKESVIGKNRAETQVKEAAAFRDSVAQVADQAGWDALRTSLGERGARLPAQFSPELQESLVSTAGDVIKRRTPNFQIQDIGGKKVSVDINPYTNPAIKNMQFDKTVSPDAALSAETARRGQNMTDSRAREANAISKEAAQTQLVNDPNQGLLLVNKGTKVATPATFGDGKPVPSESAVAAGKLNRQLQQGIAMARELIPKATSSGMGAKVDEATGFFGKSTPGADAASQLDTLAGWMVSNVPRMQGPQSDKDVLLYRQMAAQVGDRNQPTSRRMAALDTLEALQAKYADINATPYAKPEAPQAPAKGPQIPKIKGDAEYNALPSGATFIDPNGVTRRKP